MKLKMNQLYLSMKYQVFYTKNSLIKNYLKKLTLL